MVNAEASAQSSSSAARESSPPDRVGKDLLDATRRYVERSRGRSWWYLSSTLAFLVSALIAAAMLPPWPARLAASVLGGLLMGRTFILYHDFLHGSLLKGSPVARVLLHGVGLFMLAPPRSWRWSHNYHHANVAKLVDCRRGSDAAVSDHERWLEREHRLCVDRVAAAGHHGRVL